MQRVVLAAVMVALGCRSRHEGSSSAAVAPRSAAASAAGVIRASPVASNPAPPPPPSALPYTLPPETNFDALPVVEPEPCSDGGLRTFIAVPRARWQPILDAAARGWPLGVYAPNDCMRSVRARCAPDLDGAPGAEVLVEVAYRVPHDGIIETAHPLSPSCGSKDRSTQGVLLALSPPPKSGGEWSFHGIVGFTSNVTGEGGWDLTVKGFVRLPNGATGVRAHGEQPGFTTQYDLVEAFDTGAEWRNVGVHDLPAADGGSPTPGGG